MIKERTFNVVFVKDNHGGGVEPAEQVDRVVTYFGNSISASAVN
jgi:hypothetical protein